LQLARSSGRKHYLVRAGCQRRNAVTGRPNPAPARTTRAGSLPLLVNSISSTAVSPGNQNLTVGRQFDRQTCYRRECATQSRPHLVQTQVSHSGTHAFGAPIRVGNQQGIKQFFFLINKIGKWLSVRSLVD
jgi:hypothetical protein